MRKNKEIVTLTCCDCNGSGKIHHFKKGIVACGRCRGTGEVTQVVWKIPQEDNALESK